MCVCELFAVLCIVVTSSSFVACTVYCARPVSNNPLCCSLCVTGGATSSASVGHPPPVGTGKSSPHSPCAFPYDACLDMVNSTHSLLFYVVY